VTPEPTESAKLKICLAGDEGVGKTSLVRRFVLSEFDERYLRTVGVVVYKRVVFLGPIRGKTYAANLTVWDVLGGAGFAGRYGDAYLTNAAGILAVCDLTRPETLQGLAAWFDRAKAAVGNVPAIILANKVDMTDHVRIKEDDMVEFRKRFDFPYMETSAKTGQNVGTAFARLAEAALRAGLPAEGSPAVESPRGSFQRPTE